jgi:hypothetical protein
MSFLAPASKFKVLKTLRRVGRTNFLETLGGPYGFCKGERMAEICFVQWVLQDLCSDPMLIFQ